MFFLCLLFPSLASQSNCPSYSCGSLNSSMIEDTCVQNISNVFSVSPCLNDTLYCQVSSSGKNGTCQQPRASSFISAFPGESCGNETTCAYGSCVGSICTGLSNGTICSLTQQCDVGLSCQNFICTSQIPIGGLGCSNDYDCVNNAGCDPPNTKGLGICVEYYSINPSTKVSFCYGNSNNLCTSGSCLDLNETFYCVPELGNWLDSPYECTTTDYCYSEIDSTTGNRLTGKCECGLNGKSYCSLLPGDAETYEYKMYRNAWVGSQEIHDCHTMRRFRNECISEKWDKKQVNYAYNEKFVKMYPIVYNASECILQTLYPEYYAQMMLAQTSGAYLISFLSVFLLS